MKITHLWKKVYNIDYPAMMLWSQADIASIGTWPKLRVGKKHRFVQCMQARVRGVAGDKESYNYLVVRMSDKKIVECWEYLSMPFQLKSK